MHGAVTAKPFQVFYQETDDGRVCGGRVDPQTILFPMSIQDKLQGHKGVMNVRVAHTGGMPLGIEYGALCTGCDGKEEFKPFAGAIHELHGIQGSTPNIHVVTSSQLGEPMEVPFHLERGVRAEMLGRLNTLNEGMDEYHLPDSVQTGHFKSVVVPGKFGSKGNPMFGYLNSMRSPENIALDGRSFDDLDEKEANARFPEYRNQRVNKDLYVRPEDGTRYFLLHPNVYKKCKECMQSELQGVNDSLAYKRFLGMRVHPLIDHQGIYNDLRLEDTLTSHSPDVIDAHTATGRMADSISFAPRSIQYAITTPYMKAPEDHNRARAILNNGELYENDMDGVDVDMDQGYEAGPEYEEAEEAEEEANEEAEEEAEEEEGEEEVPDLWKEESVSSPPEEPKRDLEDELSDED